MGICLNCGKSTNIRIEYEFKLCDSCLTQFISEWINTLKPSIAKDFDCKNLFPEILITDMNQFLIKDINELLRCVENSLWTASVLMSTRIFETELKKLLKSSVKGKVPETIGGCINMLRKLNFSEGFISHLANIKDLRNEAMHGTRRFSSDEAINVCKNTLGLVAWIYNIK